MSRISLRNALRSSLSRATPSRAVQSPRLSRGRPFSSSTSAGAGRAGGQRFALQIGTAVVISLGTVYYFSPPIKLDSQPRGSKASSSKQIPFSEVSKHNKPDDLWVVIEGKVYDLTDFASNGHPGGAAPILNFAGKDATPMYKTIHPPGVIENMLDPSACKGEVDPSTVPAAKVEVKDEEEKIPLSQIIGLPDFNEAARRNLSAKAWAYMSSGATDEYTLDLNRKAWNSVLFRPRVLVNVDQVDTATTMLGHNASLPIFIAPTGMAGLANPIGEPGLTAAAGECGVTYMISTNASTPLKDIVAPRSSPAQPLFMQLYVDKNRKKTEELLKLINGLDVKAIFVTVDAPVSGKREADERSLAEVSASSGISGGKVPLKTDSRGGGLARAVGGFIDPKLNWEDIKWIRKQTKLPVGLKGVQTVEDAKKAVEMGIEAIYLSNHGGRSLDGEAPALYTLMEINKLAPEVFQKCEVYIDGGVRRGTDIVKAVCLGAKGVGMGRPFLYSLTYGKEGVVHAIEILRDEIQTTMRMLGVTSLNQLGPHLLNTKALDPLIMDEIPKPSPRI